MVKAGQYVKDEGPIRETSLFRYVAEQKACFPPTLKRKKPRFPEAFY
jgi:hypothetical protein